jgi:hypothetical protein
MEEHSVNVRIESAIGSSSPFDALLVLSQSLKTEGLSQREMYDLFASYARRYQEHDESKYEAIVDTMDLICGYCAPSKRLFETDLQT